MFKWLFTLCKRVLYLCVFPDDKVEKPINGEDKGDSGVDMQTSEGTTEEEEAPCYYDKTKSFFDNISCDDNR